MKEHCDRDRTRPLCGSFCSAQSASDVSARTQSVAGWRGRCYDENRPGLDWIGMSLPTFASPFVVRWSATLASLALICSCSAEPPKPIEVNPTGVGGMSTSAATPTSGTITTSAVTTGTVGTTGMGGATGSVGATGMGGAASSTTGLGGTTDAGAGGSAVVSPNLMGDAASTEGCDRGPTIIETSCALADCHLDEREPNFVGDFITNLRVAGTRSALCQRTEDVGGQMVNEYRLIIDPDNPADSYIIEKINPLPCEISDPTEQFITGFQMPLAPGTTNMTVALSAEDIQCLTDWIMAVAPP